MLAYYSGWNYLLELYFWLIIGALLIISITIFFGRPRISTKEKVDMEINEGTIQPLDTSEPKAESNEEDNVIDEEEEEIVEQKTPELLISEEKKKWAIGFSVFGLVFVMVGAILLFISDMEFSVFLGSCMIYIGMLSLVKGISFQIPQERVLINLSISLLVFFLNFFLLFHLLEVIGNGPMMEKSGGRKFGDFILVYTLPYLLWRIEPSTNIEGFEVDEEEPRYSKASMFSPYGILLTNVKLFLLTFTLFFFAKDIYYIAILREYAKLGFEVATILLPYSTGIPIIFLISDWIFRRLK